MNGYAKMAPASSLIKTDALPAQGVDAPSGSYSPLSQRRIHELARAAGFTDAGIVSLPHAGTERDAARFTEFIAKGYAGSMAYLARRNEQEELVRSRIDLPFPWARSVVV